MSISKKDLKELIANGYIHFYAIFEMVGNPKEFVEDSLKKYIHKMKELEGIKLLSYKIANPEKLENPENKTFKLESEKPLWSAFAEVEFLAKDVQHFTWLCINFLPSSIEIIEPTEFVIDNVRFGHILNDFVAKLHVIDGLAKSLEFKHKHLAVAFTTLAKNSVALALKDGAKTLQELNKATGLSLQDLENVLTTMVRSGKVFVFEKDGEKMFRL